MFVIGVKAAPEYANDPEFIALRDSMRHSFNDGDSTRFFRHVKVFQDYLLAKDDLHAYYTQRCNEIVFLMNRMKIVEAYKLAQQLSRELREKKLESEMYMAYNMLGHIYRYCGNEDAAIENWNEVLRRMQRAGYRESMPPIYMNIVNVLTSKDPDEALRLLNEALNIARETSPERVFDIETRRALIYYSMGDTAHFKEAYDNYEEGLALGQNSVHGRELEIYHTAMLGNIEEAVNMAHESLGNDGYGTVADIYQKAGMWQEAYLALQRANELNDSTNAIILSNSMEGVRSELRIYDAERRATRTRNIMFTITIGLLGMLVVTLSYIMWSRRRHMRQLQNAYRHALESDNMKTAFIQNVSHEVRTPLNIISGFAQVLSNPDLETNQQQRHDMAKMITQNTKLITSLIDEMLELSMSENTKEAVREEKVNLNNFLTQIVDEYRNDAPSDVKVSLKSSQENSFTFNTNKHILTSIMNSLLSNALKYTEKGSITVLTSVDDENVTIAIEDTGIGIPADKAELIFERFVKLDTFKQGIGLGLPLSRVLAGRLGGTVNLDTSYKGGSRFVITLPLA
ncbi:MAG: tetratricopeptide repeat-containing sensor histidine kinase [Prevotella sp.]|nr:tetratricopeptide repeat-containing sensor histidine kinase [Prevotella sp.]